MKIVLLIAFAVAIVFAEEGEVQESSETDITGDEEQGGKRNAAGCGPVCMIACEFGQYEDERGCPVCRCYEKKPASQCKICRKRCQYGFVYDKGCPICECRLGPW